MTVWSPFFNLFCLSVEDRGDYVIREGETGDGIYFIWDGEAEVCGFNQVDDENRLEFQLKQFDYFGHGLATTIQPAEVIALSKLTCLVLPHEHNNLLQPKSIWNADKERDTCPLVEHILHLEPIEVGRRLWGEALDLFRLQWLMPGTVKEALQSWNHIKGKKNLKVWSVAPLAIMWVTWKEENRRALEGVELDFSKLKSITLPDAPKFGKVFGGQFLGQALAAASKTVDSLKIVHSVHAYFLLVGDFDIPIIYQVYRVRDGKSFATRRVDAIQKGNVVFTLIASFQKYEDGFDHQDAKMPNVPDPETLLSMEDLREMRKTDPRLPRSDFAAVMLSYHNVMLTVSFDRTYRNKVATANFVPWPIEIRFCEPNNATNQTKSPPSLKYWFRAKGKLSDDQALHRCVAAYTSDLIFLTVSLNPHRKKDLSVTSVSLDHSNCHWTSDDFLDSVDIFCSIMGISLVLPEKISSLLEVCCWKSLRGIEVVMSHSECVNRFQMVSVGPLFANYNLLMWFHRPLRADDWILFVIHSPAAHNARGFVWGQMFNRKGELVVSLTQEGLLRPGRRVFLPKL
ncbi:putative rRNA-processing protein FCF1 -like protein [Capsicum annuum]|nr:putative rRNA-processing protein FCF1 -like protein [Capsicum annuum]